jgi:hypothetical protein
MFVLSPLFQQQEGIHGQPFAWAGRQTGILPFLHYILLKAADHKHFAT